MDSGHGWILIQESGQHKYSQRRTKKTLKPKREG